MSDQDRGGIRFPIVVRDDLSGFDRFDQRMEASLKKWDKFRDQLASLGASAEGAASRMRPLAEATAAVARATDARAAGARESARATEEEASAERRLERILQRRQERVEVLNLADERQLDITSRLTQAQNIEAEAQQRVADAVKRRKVEVRALQIAEERGVELGRRKAAVLSVEGEAEKQLAKAVRDRAVAERVAALASERGISLSQRSARAFDAQAEAAKRAARADRERATAAALAALGRDSRGRVVTPGLADAITSLPAANLNPLPLLDSLRQFQAAPTFMARLRAEVAQVSAEVGRAEGGLSQFLFTFRRLVGVFAVFQGVRAVFNGVVASLREAVGFSARIEQSTLGIASIIASVGRVTDATGQSTDAVRSFALAQEEARKQVVQLRVEALRTSATFEDLAETFQVAIAPGLQGGLNLDQIRTLTVRISQAAAGIGLPQNQLPEEIRSLLTGTIQPRTTRIATALDISNPDIQRAREAGTLAQLLEERFAKFAIAAEQGAGSFNILVANLRDGFSQLLGESAKGLFVDLKALLADLLKGLTAVSDQGIQINPRALAIVAGVVGGVQSVVGSVKALFLAVDTAALVRISDALGSAVAAIGDAAVLLIPPLLRVLATFSPILDVLGALIAGIQRLDSLLGGVVGFTVQWYATFKLIGLLLPSIQLLLRQIAIASVAASAANFAGGGALGGLAALVGSAGSLLSPLTLIAGGIALVASTVIALANNTDEAGEAVEESRKRFENFGAAVVAVGASVSAPAQSIKKLREQVTELTEEYAKATDALRLALDTRGSGNSAEALREIQGISTKLRTDAKTLEGDRTAALARQRALASELVLIENQRSLSGLIQRENFDALVAGARSFQEITEQIATEEAKLATATGLQADAIEGSIISLRARRDVIEDTNTKIIEGSLRVAGQVAVRDSTTVAYRKILSLVQEQLKAERDRVVVGEDLLALDQARARLTAEIAKTQFAGAREGLVRTQTQAAIENAAARAQVSAANARARAAREIFQTGFGGRDAAQRLSEAQIEADLARDGLRASAERGAAELRSAEIAAERASALVVELKAAQDLAQTEEDRQAIGEAVREGVALEAELAQSLADIRDKSTLDRLAGERKVLDVVQAAFIASEQAARAGEREAASRESAGEAAVQAESIRSQGLEEQLSRVDAIGESERALAAIRRDFSAEQRRLDILREQQAIHIVERRQELDVLVATRERLVAAGLLAGLTQAQAEAAENVRGADEAILRLQVQIAAVRAADATENTAERLKAVGTARQALLAVRETAAAEARQSRDRLLQLQAEASAQQFRVKLRAIERDNLFDIADGVRTVVNLEGETSGALARLTIMEATQRREEALLEAAIAQTRSLEAQARLRVAAAASVEERFAGERYLNDLLATREQLEERLGVLRDENKAKLDADILSIRDKLIQSFEGLRNEAVRNTRSVADTALRLGAENSAARGVLDARSSLLLIERQIADVRGQTDIAEKEIAILDRVNEAEERRLATLLSVTREREQNLRANPATVVEADAAAEAVLAIEREILKVQELNTEEREKQLRTVDELKVQLELLRLIEQQPVKAGALVAFRQLYEEATNTFQFTLDFAKQAITGFASTISGILTDALDPEKDVDIKERFRQFFLGLLNSITTFLITLGIVTAALSVIPGFKESLQLVAAFNGATGGGIGRAEGGTVPSRAPASPAHYASPRGFALGGRPRGLDPRDTVPIWVQPGEYVLRKAAVQSYGLGTIEALNRGLVDPSAFGGSAVRNVAPVRSAGYARGGAIPTAATASTASAAERSETLVLPVLVANEESMERLLASAPNAVRGALQRNRGMIQGLVQTGRGGNGR